MTKIDISTFREIASLKLNRIELYSQILERLVQVIDAHAGAVWDCSSFPAVSVAECSGKIAKSIPISNADRTDLLSHAFNQQQCVVVRSSESDTDSPWILLAPVKGNECHELIELIVPKLSGDRENQLLEFVNEICEICSKRLGEDHSNAPVVPGQTTNDATTYSIEQFSQFIHAIHKSVDRNLTCRNVANESRRLLDCDRVSVVWWHRGKFKILAISGQVSVNRRSNTVSLVERLADKVLKTEAMFWYPSDADIAPQLKVILDEYLSVSATRSLVIFPVFEDVVELVEDPESGKRNTNSVIGGVVFEHCNEQWLPNEMAPTLKFIANHNGDALRNSKKHHDLFMFPIWNFLGKSRILMAPRVLPKTLLVAGALLLASLVLLLWQVPFYVSADGMFVPKNRQWVFSQTTGDVQSVLVEHGDKVKKNETLVVLKSEELRMRIEETMGRIESLEQRRAAIEGNRFNDFGAVADDNISSIAAEIESSQKQLSLLSKMEQKLFVKSPMEGQVLTWDVKRNLEGRTVQPSQLLIEVADPSGEWELELDVEDRRVGHLLRAMERDKEVRLKVQFSLAADPSRTFEGLVVGRSESMRIGSGNRQIFRIRVAALDGDIDLKQAKTGVAAKIYCGYNTSLGYLWLHDIPETFNRYVWFYFSG